MTLQPLTSSQVRNHIQGLYFAANLGEKQNLIKSSCLAVALREALDQSLPEGLPDTYGDGRDFTPTLGICAHLCYNVAEDLVGICALQFSWCDLQFSWCDLQFSCCDLEGPSYLREAGLRLPYFPLGKEEYANDNLWVGESLTKRLQLLDAIIEATDWLRR